MRWLWLKLKPLKHHIGTIWHHGSAMLSFWDTNPTRSESQVYHDPWCTVSQAIPHPVRPVRTSVASRQVPPLVAGENDLRVQALHHLKKWSNAVKKNCQRMSRFCNSLWILFVYSAYSAVSDKSIPWNTPKGQRCRRSQESPPALAPSNDFAAWILLLETSNNMASIWEDNGRHWILMSQSRVSLVLLKATCLAVKIPGCFHLSKGQLCLWTPRGSTPPAGYSSGCHKTRKDLQMHEMWPLVATCNSCGKIIKSSSSQWGLSLARRIGVHSQLFSTVLNGCCLPTTFRHSLLGTCN